jgi:hypothetical protein
VRVAIGRKSAEAAQRGTLASGSALLTVCQEAAASIPIRGAIALSLLARALAAHRVQITASIGAAARELLVTMLERESEKLRGAAKSSPPFRSVLPANAQEQALTEIAEKTKWEMDRLEGEIALWVAGSKKKNESAEHMQMTFHGPVGLVQTGGGNFSSVKMHMDAGAKEAIEKALTELSTLLERSESSDPFDVIEVKQMVEETQTELAKPTSNATKIKALISGIGSAISYAPRVKVAYDTLKWAAALIGVTLP